MKIALLLAATLCYVQVNAMEPITKSSTTASKHSPVTTAFSFIHSHNTSGSCNLQWKLTSNTGVKTFMVESTYEDPTDPYSQWQPVGWVNAANNSGISKISDNGLLPGIINYRITALSNTNAVVVVSDIYTTTIQ